MNIWSDVDAALADEYGWQLVELYDTRGYLTHAVVPKTKRFEQPFQAMTFVWGQAKVGIAVARKALSIISASELAGKSSVRKKK